MRDHGDEYYDDDDDDGDEYYYDDDDDGEAGGDSDGDADPPAHCQQHTSAERNQGSFCNISMFLVKGM